MKSKYGRQFKMPVKKINVKNITLEEMFETVALFLKIKYAAYT